VPVPVPGWWEPLVLMVRGLWTTGRTVPPGSATLPHRGTRDPRVRVMHARNLRVGWGNRCGCGIGCGG
ncbi:MAG TPA: hypothetical protein VL330_23140, partial [Actinomycetes bacterium]|nr:hypothetical protein [Actinomycetes bacterium]